MLENGYQPHPLNPPLLEKERGRRFLREASPLFDFPLAPTLIEKRF
jgi:hypothetical protein